MDKHTLNEYQPDYAVPPGDVLAVELEMRGMTQQELAKRTGLTPKHIVAIAKAKSAITPGDGNQAGACAWDACGVLVES